MIRNVIQALLTILFIYSLIYGEYIWSGLMFFTSLTIFIINTYKTYKIKRTDTSVISKPIGMQEIVSDHAYEDDLEIDIDWVLEHDDCEYVQSPEDLNEEIDSIEMQIVQDDIEAASIKDDSNIIVLVQSYPFNTSVIREVLKESGFSIVIYSSGPPDAETLERELSGACQMWWSGGPKRTVTEDHIEIVSRFFASGGGVYLWGDNNPLYVDTNILGKRLAGVSMEGDTPGNNIIGPDDLSTHPVNNGVERVREGVSIATINPNDILQPIMYGSDGNLISAALEEDGKRLIIDGGFSRLYYKKDYTDTHKHLQNSAKWLAGTRFD
jgi:hypothetical protein